MRIPKSIAAEARLEQDALVDLSSGDGNAIVQRVPDPEVTLEQLLARVTEENRHGEVDTGPATGQEVW